MRGGQAVLSDRLRMLAGLVTPGYTVADVGCDHAFLSIYLVQRSISPRVLAMDVREGPLAAAREHIGSCGLGTYIETRLSDGLARLGDGEAESLICAGMGGRLMQRILRDGMRKARVMRELILQPQSEIGEFRAFLREGGFRITAEDAVCEDGKYYFAMKAVYAGDGGDPASCEREEQLYGYGGDPASCEREEQLYGYGGAFASCAGGERLCEDGGTPGTADWQRLFDEYGELLLMDGHPVLRRYLAHRKEEMVQIRGKLEMAGGSRAGERLAEVDGELERIEAALRMFHG